MMLVLAARTEREYSHHIIISMVDRKRTGQWILQEMLAQNERLESTKSNLEKLLLRLVPEVFYNQLLNSC